VQAHVSTVSSGSRIGRTSINLNSDNCTPLKTTSGVTILILLWLFAINQTIFYLKPLRYYSMGGYISKDQEPLQDQYDQFLARKNSITAVMLGSSLPCCAMGCADARFEKRPSPKVDYDLFCYVGCKYLNSLIDSSKYGSNGFFNFSGNGCMMSDSYRVLDELIQQGAQPKLVIACVAPRDFLDNLACRTGETAYYRFFDALHAKSRTADLAAALDKYLRTYWYFYYVRRDYQTLAMILATSTLNRPLDLYAASQPQNASQRTKLGQVERNTRLADSVGKEQDKAKDLITYQHNYLPLDYARYRTEISYLPKLIVAARRVRAKCLIVSMPLSKENIALLPAEMKNRYFTDLNLLCKENGAELLNLTESSEFAGSDFRDSAHLNGSGGMKFSKLLAAKLSEQ
jgi:hypothetical protein